LAASTKGALAEKKDVELWKLQPDEAVKSNYKDGADLWKKLTGGSCWYDAPVDPLKNVKTASGKFELAAQLLQAKGLAVADDQLYLPHFSQMPPRGSDKDFPLMLVTYHMSALADQNFANPPFMTKTVFDFILKHSDQFVEINPATAASLGVLEGDSAVLKTPQGEVNVRIHVFAGARPGVVYLAQGLGHKAQDEYIKDKGVNANGVVEVQLDRVTGLGTIWAARAHLRRA
jgi:menaquinone reductase, molybdopterin-binding-like subunit